MFVTRSGESTANPSVRVIWAPTNSGVCVGTTLDFFELIKKNPGSRTLRTINPMRPVVFSGVRPYMSQTSR